MKAFWLRFRRVACLLLCFAMLLSSGSILFASVAAGDLSSATDSAQYELEAKCRVADGSTVKVTVRYAEDIGIPRKAKLLVSEISETDARYADYLHKARQVIHAFGRPLSFTKLLDISIVDKADPDRIYQPSIGTSVDVRISLSDDDELDARELNVVHFAGRSETPQVIDDVNVENGDVCFETDGFSAYAIVEGPSAADVTWTKISSVSELASMASAGMYIGHVDGYYFSNSTYRINSSRTGITKTKPAASYPGSAAALYYFEFVDGSTNQFRAYCYDSNDIKQYVSQNSNSLTLTTSYQNATVFTVEPYGDLENTFRVTGPTGQWNMQGGASGSAFATYNNANDVNARLNFWHLSVLGDDVYGLDGQSFGLMNYSGGLMGKALMSTALGNDSLEAMNLVVLNKESNREDELFVSNDSDISEWTFQWVADDRYYLRSTVDGSTKYLKVTANGLSMVSEPDETCALRVIPGTGSHAGQICLKSGNSTLTYSGSLSTGFTVGGAAGSEWLDLVELSELTSDYLMTYSARKVSVSDSETVTNGSKVILYTRVWNDTDKRYEFYAVDYDGTLVPCYESGDSIKWVGNRINTLQWNFVEYYWEGTTDPNYYYELYNPYSEQYIAPQVTGEQILSDNTIGINLNGRRNGYYYSTIVAWDDANFSYVALKTEDGEIVSCPLREGEDFYFAIIEEDVVDDTLTTIETVNNYQHGITMKMVDFTEKVKVSNSSLEKNTQNEQDVLLGSNAGGLNVPPTQGLLSTNLDENGYPTAVRTGESFGDLYEDATPANHLFIQSIYNASGYFEYNSTQNFASLDGENFTVYEELGTMDVANRETLKHGQFMPYNDLEAGVFASVNSKNLYDYLANELPNSNPRKNEQMYLVRQPDYYFGMELEASFVQTPNGHDAWGHDIIYEFTGDDDFWLYVDGELVIDLGGIHSALPGTVNFCTGQVTVNGVSTTLYDIFYNNYLGRGHTVEETEAYVDEIFQQNSHGQWVFKDYTTHTMRIFYMERGAGASNLHMRFNLASVKPGTVLLSKELGNVDEPESVLAEYPYQIYYMKAEDPNEYLLTEDNLNIKVFYKDTITPVTYKPTLTIDGITYNSVFILKPTEIAEIDLPDDAISYRIVECGINTDVYSSVYVNGEEIEGAEINGHDNRMDYGIDFATAKARSRVTYRNNVDPAALRNLTIKKILYDETGVNELHNDPAVFGIRLYLGAEYEESTSLAYMASYHVKDENGVYCVWNVAQQRFDPLGPGKTDYSLLSNAEKQSVTFTSSMNGSISKIPAFYTVEVRDVLAGTQYGVQERDYEIPDGYSLQKYVLYLDGAGTTGVEDNDPVSGTIEANKDPHVDVCNLKGWGLRVNKQWSDADYMSQRGPTYFAVYTGTTEQNLTLVPGTVRQMPQSTTTLYWYFQTLPVNVPFEQYEIREVVLTNPTVDANGYVTAYDSITPIPQDGEVTINGTQIGETSSSGFTYTVLYDKGTLDADSNVRVDTTTNNRPGIVLKKAEWDGTTPLAGAQFTLTDETDTLIGTFTSDATGLITVAFLRDNVDYSLTEIRTPQGYLGLPSDLTLRLSNGTVTVSGVDAANYVLTQGTGITPTLVVKNRTRDFSVLKKDADTNTYLAGVHFALHRQVTVGDVTTIDFNPMPGYEDLVTTANGTIPRLDNTLPAGTYELRETAALNGYQPLPAYIRMTISPTGVIHLGSHPDTVTLTETENQDGSISYTLSIPNTQRIKVSIWKTDEGHTAITSGASFSLYRAEDYIDAESRPIANAQPVMTGTTGTDGILYLGELMLGDYRLVETQAPDGYSLPFAAIQISVTANSVTAIQGGRAAEVVQKNDPNGYWVSGQDDDTWQVRVWNLAGIAMPHIGGIGTTVFYFAGFALILLAAYELYKRRKRVCIEK